MNESLSDQVAVLLAQPNWTEERKALRACLLEAGLAETIKWNQLCYQSGTDNVAIIFAMKASCGIGFFKGALLDDPKGQLTKQGPNSQAMREFRFASLAQIESARSDIAAMIKAAIAVERAGLKVTFVQKDALDPPAELTECFARDPDFCGAFEALTPGRQRAYVLHFSGAKQSSTRAARIEKHRARIMAGKGIADR